MLEPGTPYLHGRVIEAICEHLEAVTAGQIRRLLINVPPGTAKSLLASVLWPASVAQCPRTVLHRWSRLPSVVLA